MNPININTEIISSKTSVGGRRQASIIASMQNASRVPRGHLQPCEHRQPPDLGRDGALQVVGHQAAAQGRTRGGAATVPRRRGAAAAPRRIRVYPQQEVGTPPAPPTTVMPPSQIFLLSEGNI
eukprot:460093-Prorocentrum_minimum.AAC.1